MNNQCKVKPISILILFITAGLLLSACSPAATPEPTFTMAPTQLPTATTAPTSTATSTPTPTSTETPTLTPTESPTPTISPTVTQTMIPMDGDWEGFTSQNNSIKFNVRNGRLTQFSTGYLGTWCRVEISFFILARIQRVMIDNYQFSIFVEGQKPDEVLVDLQGTINPVTHTASGTIKTKFDRHSDAEYHAFQNTENHWSMSSTNDTCIWDLTLTWEARRVHK